MLSPICIAGAWGGSPKGLMGREESRDHIDRNHGDESS